MTVGVITGAASGMGRACVDAMVGTVDVLLAVDRAPIDIPAAVPVACDVRDEEAIGVLVDRVRESGDFRFLVNAAGMSPTMADARTIIDVNLLGTVRLLDALDPLVVPGSVAIPFSSSAGYLPEMLTLEQTELLRNVRVEDFLDRAQSLISDSGLAYVFSKVGVQREARATALRWAPRGGRVVSLSPGNIDTPMGRLELENQPLMQQAQAAHPMRRLGGPEEIASVVAFLASDKASFVSGVDVLVDGAERAQALAQA